MVYTGMFFSVAGPDQSGSGLNITCLDSWSPINNSDPVFLKVNSKGMLFVFFKVLEMFD